MGAREDDGRSERVVLGNPFADESFEVDGVRQIEKSDTGTPPPKPHPRMCVCSFLLSSR